MLRFFRLFTFIMLLSWMAVIYSFSAQPALQSGTLSGGFTHNILCLVWKEYREMPPAEQLIAKDRIDKVIRKCAHFTIFAVLGFIASAVSFSYKTGRKARYILPALFCLLYAVSDEFHQLYVPGRACEARDVCIDFCGSLLGLAAAYLAAKVFRLVRNK